MKKAEAQKAIKAIAPEPMHYKHIKLEDRLFDKIDSHIGETIDEDPQESKPADQ